MKKVAAALLLGVGSIAVLSGCSATETKTPDVQMNGKVPIFQVELENGKTLDCIYIRRVGPAEDPTGGPTCDWANAK